MNTHRNHDRSRSSRSGAVLVEFAFIALAFYLLFAGTIELGRMITTAQAVQNAARVGARELALMPLPATATFEEALADPEVKALIYNPALLAVPVSGGNVPDTDEWPIVNRMLTPLMILDTVGGVELFHYPGAVLQGAGGLTVRVPQVVERADDGSETIRWVDVVEEVVYSDGLGPFSLAAAPLSGGQPRERGLVALRINCPYQAATMTAYHVQGPVGQPIEAQDHLDSINEMGGTPVGTASDIGAYAGPEGLGKLYALGKTVRPFRRLISAQSLFRREVYR